MTDGNTTSFRQRYAQLLVTERLRQGLSQAELARRAGLAPQYVNDYEHGVRNLRLDNFEKLLSAVGLIDATSGPPLRERLAHNLRAFREKQGHSQEALAAKAGLHRTYISMLERNQRNASLDHVERVARTLGVSEEDLIGISLLNKIDF